MRLNQYLKRASTTSQTTTRLMAFSLIFFLLSLNSYSQRISEQEQLGIDNRIVKQKVLEWADSVFYFHEGYKFEKFEAHYTEDFYLMMLRLDQYKQGVLKLKDEQEQGYYVGSNSDYLEELAELKRKYKKFKYFVDSFELRSKYFEIVFWSNIQTKHGYMVYYSHKFKLSNDYVVMSSTIKDAIGNRNEANTVILNQ